MNTPAKKTHVRCVMNVVDNCEGLHTRGCRRQGKPCCRTCAEAYDFAVAEYERECADEDRHACGWT